jgi:hypothetical protein
MQPQVVSPAPQNVWQAMLNTDPNALVSQTPAWTDCLCAAEDYTDASRLRLGAAFNLIVP